MQYIYVPGYRVGKLTVLREAEKRNGRYMCDCICDCGNEVSVRAESLKRSDTRTCGHCPTIFAGDRFGKLVVIKESEKKGLKGARFYDCLCDCGNELTVSASNLKRENTKSCGCLHDVEIGFKSGKLTVIKMSALRSRGRKMYECLCEYGNCTIVRGSRLKCGDTKSCGHCPTIFVGDRFGKLVVLKKSDKKGTNNSSFFDCRCDCGNLFTVIGSRLKNNTAVSCGCISKYTDRNFALIKRRYSGGIIDSSRKLGLNYDLTFNDYEAMIQKPCFYCGCEGTNISNDYNYKKNEKFSDTMIVCNGIDRIDSKKGYTKDNVVPCCKHCNSAKSDKTIEEFKL